MSCYCHLAPSFDMNAEAIYNVCNDEIDDLHIVIMEILDSL